MIADAAGKGVKAGQYAGRPGRDRAAVDDAAAERNGVDLDAKEAS